MASEAGLRVLLMLVPIGIAGFLFAFVGISAVAVAIFGPRTRRAVILPAVATFTFGPVTILTVRGPNWAIAAIAFVLFTFGVALFQRYALERTGADRLPIRPVIGGIALGLVLEFVASLAGGSQALPVFLMIGVVVGLAAAWRRVQPAVEGS